MPRLSSESPRRSQDRRSVVRRRSIRSIRPLTAAASALLGSVMVGVAAFTLLGPVSETGVAQETPQSAETASLSQIYLAYTVNNQGYLNTCG